MIFITLGSQKFQFNRLLKAVDELVERGEIQEEVYAQIGYSDYLPQHYGYTQFVDREEFYRLEKMADIVITHGGTGAIIGAVKQGKKVIAVPRLSKYGEHVDDHQLQLLQQFSEMGLVCVCMDCGGLGEALEYTRQTHFKDYVSNGDAIIANIERYIKNKVEINSTSGDAR